METLGELWRSWSVLLRPAVLQAPACTVFALRAQLMRPVLMRACRRVCQPQVRRRQQDRLQEQHPAGMYDAGGRGGVGSAHPRGGAARVQGGPAPGVWGGAPGKLCPAHCPMAPCGVCLVGLGFPRGFSVPPAAGPVAEHIRRKADRRRPAFSRCLAQDYPKSLPSGARVGFTVINQVCALCF